MTVYWDTSALAAVLLQDRGYELIEAWITAYDAPNAISDFTWGELVSSAAIRVRSGRLDHEGGRQTLAIADRFVTCWSKHPLVSADVENATTFVGRFDLCLRLPDAIHIAIAQRIGATLVTTDHDQRNAARAIGLTVHDPLEDHA